MSLLWQQTNKKDIAGQSATHDPHDPECSGGQDDPDDLDDPNDPDMLPR